MIQVLTQLLWPALSSISAKISRAADRRPGPSVWGLHHPPTNTLPSGSSNLGLILTSNPWGSVSPWTRFTQLTQDFILVSTLLSSKLLSSMQVRMVRAASRIQWQQQDPPGVEGSGAATTPPLPWISMLASNRAYILLQKEESKPCPPLQAKLIFSQGLFPDVKKHQGMPLGVICSSCPSATWVGFQQHPLASHCPWFIPKQPQSVLRLSETSQDCEAAKTSRAAKTRMNVFMPIIVDLLLMEADPVDKPTTFPTSQIYSPKKQGIIQSRGVLQFSMLLVVLPFCRCTLVLIFGDVNRRMKCVGGVYE